MLCLIGRNKDTQREEITTSVNEVELDKVEHGGVLTLGPDELQTVLDDSIWLVFFASNGKERVDQVIRHIEQRPGKASVFGNLLSDEDIKTLRDGEIVHFGFPDEAPLARISILYFSTDHDAKEFFRNKLSGRNVVVEDITKGGFFRDWPQNEGGDDE